MLVIGYVRVSSLEQEHGYGPAVQAAAIRAYCQQTGLAEPELVHESMSGESIIQRQELQQILTKAKQVQEDGGQAHIVFYRLDRLSRTLMDQESVVGMSLRFGFRLHSTQPGEADTLDPSCAGDPMRTAFRQLMGMFAQLERSMIQSRLDAGLHAKAKTGESTGGRPPFGYMMLDKDIAVDPSEVVIVHRVFALRKAGMDLAGIVAVCSREFPEKCSKWNKSSVSRIIRRREMYELGRYKSAVAVTPMDRPELIILKDANAKRLAPIKDFDWDKLKDPVSVMRLSLILDVSASWIQARLSEHRLDVRWIKGKLYCPLAVARKLEALSRESKPHP